MSYATRIADILLRIQAVKLSPSHPFTWASGILSPIYCDNRMIYGYPEERSFVVDALVSRVRSLHHEPDVIAGTATAAIGWAALVADRMALPFVYVRSKPKEHGAKKRIEGHLPKLKHVLVIEDLLSTGTSSLSTVEALRTEADAVVTDIISIFSYDFPSANQAATKEKVRLHPLVSISTLLDVAREQQKITQQELELTRQFVCDPEGWKAG